MVHEGDWTGSEGKTGIDKRSVSGPVVFAQEHVANDVIVDRQAHGGYDQAVYAYAREDADWWENEIGTSIDNGRFGENLTTLGIDVNAAVVGEQWKIGSVILEVSQPRIPCRVFAGFWQRPNLIKEFMAAGRPGTYLRIIHEGEITAGDSIKVIKVPDHGITIADIYAAKNGERSKVREIAQVKELSMKYQEWAKNLNL
ncbi:MAG: molybdenum cofactor biosysynthesis protein [Actinobacteria bacterium]|nr:molybdenum cofactor biosysynthesis protein [Actinomycetota bacterium]